MVGKLHQGFVPGFAVMDHGIARQIDESAITHATRHQTGRACVAAIGIHKGRPHIPFDAADPVRILNDRRRRDVLPGTGMPP